MSVIQPQQSRSERTLERILDACDLLLTEKNFDQISMQQIASRAKVSVGNLYNRFDDKEALVNYVVERYQLRLLDQLKSQLDSVAADAGLEEKLTVMAAAITEAVSGLRPVLAALISRQSAQQSLSTQQMQNSDVLIETSARWLMQGMPYVEDEAMIERYRFAVASMAYCIQFELLLGTPGRMFGDKFLSMLADQALDYLKTCQEET